MGCNSSCLRDPEPIPLLINRTNDLPVVTVFMAIPPVRNAPPNQVQQYKCRVTSLGDLFTLVTNPVYCFDVAAPARHIEATDAYELQPGHLYYFVTTERLKIWNSGGTAIYEVPVPTGMRGKWKYGASERMVPVPRDI
jgi:hypothetical protein